MKNKTQTEISAEKWIEMVVMEKGINQAISLMKYNITKNPYFRESNQWIMAAWAKINELNPS